VAIDDETALGSDDREQELKHYKSRMHERLQLDPVCQPGSLVSILAYVSAERFLGNHWGLPIRNAQGYGLLRFHFKSRFNLPRYEYVWVPNQVSVTRCWR
jgi:hypothetical protein